MERYLEASVSQWAEEIYSSIKQSEPGHCLGWPGARPGKWESVTR